MPADELPPVRKVKTNASTATISEYGYPHGHLTHLNETESDALASFKKLLEDRGLYTPGPPASKDDATLL
jgi:hypothetical protein